MLFGTDYDTVRNTLPESRMYEAQGCLPFNVTKYKLIQAMHHRNHLPDTIIRAACHVIPTNYQPL